jgi:hypothetical protein
MNILPDLGLKLHTGPETSASLKFTKSGKVDRLRCFRLQYIGILGTYPSQEIENR